MNKFYDKLYFSEKNIFWEAPIFIVKKLVELLLETNKLKIIDLWCGNGRNLCYLAKNNFKVIWIDNSLEALKIIKDKLNNSIYKNDNVQLIYWNIQEFENYIDSSYLLSYILHFLGEEQRSFLVNLQKSTSIWYFNIIETFLNEGSITWNNDFLRSRELLSLYRDWNINYYEELFVPTMESSRKLSNRVARIIAQKKFD